MEKYCRIGDKLRGTACEQDPFSERFEVVKFIAGSFPDFDLVVVALTGAVGFVVFSSVLYVSTPVSDHVSNMAYFPNLGGTVNFELFDELSTL